MLPYYHVAMLLCYHVAMLPCYYLSMTLTLDVYVDANSTYIFYYVFHVTLEWQNLLRLRLQHSEKCCLAYCDLKQITEINTYNKMQEDVSF